MTDPFCSCNLPRSVAGLFDPNEIQPYHKCLECRSKLIMRGFKILEISCEFDERIIPFNLKRKRED